MDGRDECPLAARVPCRKEPPTRLVAEMRKSLDADVVRVSDTFVCHAKGREKKNASMREKEREGGSTFRGVEFQIRTPSINQEHSRRVTASMPCCSYTNFINHANQHTGGNGYPVGSAWPSYIFAHKVRFREIHERLMIGGCNDWRVLVGGYRDIYKWLLKVLVTMQLSLRKRRVNMGAFKNKKEETNKKTFGVEMGRERRREPCQIFYHEAASYK